MKMTMVNSGLKGLSSEGPTPGETSAYVMALGSDGATALTSKKAGVTGYLLRINPMLINYHCIAHRLALVTSQAAKDMAYIAKYQGTLTSIFYYFKASAVHTDALKAIQQVLDEPQLKVREVHDVR